METVTLKLAQLKETITLKDKIILITGAGAGIGRALALHLARCGATTILLDKSLKQLESLYDEMLAEKLPEPALHPVNFLKMVPDDVCTIKESIEQLFGRLDGIVHNAGITGPITPIVNLPPQKWQEVVHLNLNVPFILTQILLPLCLKSEQGHILFTTANESITPKAYWSAYGASKAGIAQFAATLHEEMEANTALNINTINPVMARTGLRLQAYPGLDPNSFPTAESLVPFYSYVLSEKSAPIRGKHLQIPIESLIEPVQNNDQKETATAH